jgi:DNA-binding XRE family transcriptional regulator
MEADLALRQAAAALLTTASPAGVRQVLRTLLTEMLEEPATPVTKPNGAPAARKSTGDAAVPESVRPLHQAEANWQRLRARVRERREELGLGNAELAKLLGVARSSVASAMSTTRPPSGPLPRKLAAWLEAPPTLPTPRAKEAPVAAGSPFRGNGGATHPDGRAAGAAQGGPGGA